MAFQVQTPVDVYYRDRRVGYFKSDLIVTGTVVVEAKATKALDESDRRQLLNYLRSTKLEVGLLLHFGPKPQFQRMVFSNDRKSLPVITTNE
jgi:GxxExxY protein